MKGVRFRKHRIAILIPATLGAAATFLPWVNVSVQGSTQFLNGFSESGFMLFVIFFAVAVMCIVPAKTRTSDKTFLTLSFSGGILVMIFLITKIVDFTCIAPLKNDFTTIYFPGVWIKLSAAWMVSIFSMNFKIKKPARKTVTGNFENVISIPATFATNKMSHYKFSISEKKVISLDKLVGLKQCGHITEDEFQQLKSKLILSDFLFGLFN